ncbi:hypothetical protein C8035_v005337 [Colletotrichum spinosum]|uniref:Uncharacterized protein n=1 Tax=Colletotrichum spinosum TaxID=1347390 RepID=A0A4R8QMY3_9PEZI|nr:hypothetical protein C8035_v005337 [Colletotrichum spinosum]
MYYTALLLLSAASNALSSPAPEPAFATVPAYRLLCTGYETGNHLTVDDISAAMRNQRNALQLNFGWWGTTTTNCHGTKDSYSQTGIWVTYNHERNTNAEAVIDTSNTVRCKPWEEWSAYLVCSPGA